jgi:hypothetical protein
MKKEVCSFLGHVGYYRRFITFFSKLASHLFLLLSKDVEFLWTDDCQKDFTRLKNLVFEAPILRGPNWTFPFHISSDASNTAIGVVLGQQEDHNPYIIYYINKNLAPAGLNYTVTEK